MATVSESIAKSYNGRTITIFTDSQAAFKALESVTVKSKLVLECLQRLSEQRHTTQFNWCGCRGMRASWAMRGLTKWLRRVQTLNLLDPSPYLAFRIAWSISNRGLDGEETHRVLEV